MILAWLLIKMYVKNVKCAKDYRFCKIWSRTTRFSSCGILMLRMTRHDQILKSNNSHPHIHTHTHTHTQTWWEVANKLIGRLGFSFALNYKVLCIGWRPKQRFFNSSFDHHLSRNDTKTYNHPVRTKLCHTQVCKMH